MVRSPTVFRGVPFLLNDLLAQRRATQSITARTCFVTERFVAPHDTYFAAKFKAVGFLCLAKTNTSELGLQVTTEPEAFGPTRNPWDVTRSSGGSAAAGN
jgi:amidase